MKSVIRVRQGRPFPPGASVADDGVNFSLFSRHASAVTLVIYADAESSSALHIVPLSPERQRERFIWHVFIEGLAPGVWFTWRVAGPDDRSNGHAYEYRRELLDPHARRVGVSLWRREAEAPDWGAVRGQVLDDEPFDWDGDTPLTRAREDEIIYELHLRGFTRHRSAGVASPGTFSGLLDKVSYLSELGVTAVELLPVTAFDVLDVPPEVAAAGLQNFWGYSPLAYKALHPGYAASSDIRREFRELVKALHSAGIAVILDVVFNHTAEGGPDSPAISFRGIDNRIYYQLDVDQPAMYRDYTGCGNSLNCNHPIVSQFIVDCLEYWVRDFHVDGFRFDLASVMTRDEQGEPDEHARVIWQIEQSAVLRDRILIAEPWDAVGLHQVGAFPGFAWSEWNDRYRDVVRSFLRGDGGMIGEVATRIAGSSDLYAHAGKRPGHSINFVTCHDGFTLVDLVSYNHKHNDANGEFNADGHDHNVSWNSGAEGPTDDPQIVSLRLRRVRNFVAVLLLSQGVPMLNAGDERLRTQNGNNNAYCQDNELSWIDWADDSQRSARLRFARRMIALRRRHPSLRRREFIVADDS
ncbi:MAG: glycogen debranching protein GlgX, partial [Gammaproteobacteria bacterium]